MKANGAPESRFVYPDKLYARKNKNITIDISYAPQNMEAVEYIRADAFIEKACEWFKNNWREYVNTDKDGVVCFGHWEKDFKKYMKGE